MRNEKQMVKVNKRLIAVVGSINKAVANAVNDLVEIGKSLIHLNEECQHGEWERLFKGHPEAIAEPLKMSVSTAKQLMCVARNPVLADPASAAVLPASWAALYELSQVGEEPLKKAIEDKKITPALTVLGAAKLKTLLNPATAKPSAPRVAAAVVQGRTPQAVVEVNGRMGNGDRAVVMLGDAVKGVLVVAKAGQLTEAHQEIVARYAHQLTEALSILRVKPSDASTVVAKHEPEIEKMAEKLVEKVEAHAKAKSRSRKPKPSADPVEEIATEVVASL